jgi:recombination associated protein RdgC
MPALRGSLTYARYFVEGDLPPDLHDKFLKAIRLRSMKPLEPDDAVNERSGWCRLGEPMETDIGFEDVFYNSYVNLGFRTDRWMIPGPMLRNKMRDAEKAYLQKKGRELRRELTPVTRVIDVSWSLDEGVLRFFSHAPKQGAFLEALFTKTFALKLVPEGPYTLAARIGLSSEDELRWEALEPIDLAVEEP